MENVLDNPAYYAMMTGNRHLTAGSERVRYFPAGISPFVGLKDFGAKTFDELAERLPPDRNWCPTSKSAAYARIPIIRAGAMEGR